MYVWYEFNIYEVIRPRLSERLIADLRDSCPNTMLTLQLVKDIRYFKTVKIKYVKFQFEW